MSKVLVALHNKEGKPTKRYIVWATFKLDGEAYQYERELKAKHPTWKTFVRTYGVTKF